MGYEQTRARVETYFDKTATEAWAKLTSDAPVSKIRATVRAGRDQMRDKLLNALPADLSGAHILDAGCGFGQMSEALALRGARVTAMDIAPSLLQHAAKRLPASLVPKVTFVQGDFATAPHGPFDACIAMDSLIYYGRTDLENIIRDLAQKSKQVLFTVAPKTPLLSIMWAAGQCFPRQDRSPNMVPHAPKTLINGLSQELQMRDLGRVVSGFYISHALEVQQCA